MLRTRYWPSQTLSSGSPYRVIPTYTVPMPSVAAAAKKVASKEPSPHPCTRQKKSTTSRDQTDPENIRAVLSHALMGAVDG